MDNNGTPRIVNVLCDQSATAELNEQRQTDDRPDFYPLPNTPCYLQHQGKFVTSHEDKIFLWSKPKRDLLNFISAKYNWSRTTSNIVDWDALKAARSSLPHLQFFMPKLTTSWLATLSVLAKREPIPPNCPLPDKVEDNNHIFLCQHRTALTLQLKRKLSTHLLSTHTCPQIQREIVHGISSLFTNPPQETRSSAFSSQTQIGWINLFRGFTSSLWKKRQMEYSALHLLPKTHNQMHTWSKKLTCFFITFAHSMWIERCTNVHPTTHKFETEQNRRRAEALVKAAYRHQENVSQADKEHLFSIPLETKLAESASSLINWHKTIKRVLKQSVKDHAKHQQENQSPISTYFSKVIRLRKIPTIHRKKQSQKRMTTQPAVMTRSKSVRKIINTPESEKPIRRRSFPHLHTPTDHPT